MAGQQHTIEMEEDVENVTCLISRSAPKRVYNETLIPKWFGVGRRTSYFESRLNTVTREVVEMINTHKVSDHVMTQSTLLAVLVRHYDHQQEVA